MVRRVEVETGKVSIFPVFSISEVYRSRFKMADFTPKFDLKSVKNDKDLRKIRLKLDCPSELEWERWKSGREHQKTFYVKNILNKVQVCISSRSTRMQQLLMLVIKSHVRSMYTV